MKPSFKGRKVLLLAFELHEIYGLSFLCSFRVLSLSLKENPTRCSVADALELFTAF